MLAAGHFSVGGLQLQISTNSTATSSRDGPKPRSSDGRERQGEPIVWAPNRRLWVPITKEPLAELL